MLFRSSLRAISSSPEDRPTAVKPHEGNCKPGRDAAGEDPRNSIPTLWGKRGFGGVWGQTTKPSAFFQAVRPTRMLTTATYPSIIPPATEHRPQTTKHLTDNPPQMSAADTQRGVWAAQAHEAFR